MQISLYVSKNMRNFIKICRVYVKKYFPDERFSTFVIKCIRNYVNTLSKEERDNFEECALELAKKEQPKAADYASKFIRSSKK